MAEYCKLPVRTETSCKIFCNEIQMAKPGVLGEAVMLQTGRLDIL